MSRQLRSVVAGRMAVAAVLCLLVGQAAAETAAERSHPPLQSMSAEQYEAYREQLQQQVKAAETKDAPPATTDAAEATDKEADKQEESGYGRGYSSRMSRSGGSGGGYRSGGMSRGGGGRGR